MQRFYKTRLTTILFLAFLSIFLGDGIADAKTPIKISVLKFGTVNWTLQTIKKARLDHKNGFELIIQPLANSQAGKIALQAHAADIIVSDWTWVARQRGLSTHYLFAPYSSSAGSLMVPDQSPIRSIKDLTDKRLGIAGGGLDKNWLLLRALALQKNINLQTNTDKIFGAPPLLNNLIKRGQLDALINYWHYSARLKAEGYREIINTHEIIRQLGIDKTVPIIGYVFKEQWAVKNAKELNNFLSASADAANLLCSSDKHWNAILPLTRANDKQTQQLLRSHYCKGRITTFTEEEKQAIANIYSILAVTGGEQLVGSVKQLDPQIFWDKHP